MRQAHMAFAALAAASLATPSSALADEPDWIQGARTALGAYDLEGAQTTDALSALRARVRGAPTSIVTETADTDPAIDEARFLAVAVAADLVDVALSTDDDALVRRVASALGVRPNRLAQALKAELMRMATGPFAASASDSLAGLELATARGDRRTTLLASTRGPRRDLAWLGDLRGVLVGARDPLLALAAVSADPCADAGRRCAPIYAPFVPVGRRAVATLVERAPRSRASSRAPRPAIRSRSPSRSALARTGARSSASSCGRRFASRSSAGHADRRDERRAEPRASRRRLGP